MAIELSPDFASKITATRWTSLKLYNAYRAIIALTLLVTQGVVNMGDWGISLHHSPFSSLVISYLAFSLLSALFTWLEKPSIDITLPLQIITDVIFIVLLMHAKGGSVGTTGLLLVITVASASLISEGRLAIFYAAIATIGILLEASFNGLEGDNSSDHYTSAVILSLSCFVIAWLARSLAKRIQQSELLATERGLDVQNLAQINALITHEMQDGVLVVDQDLRIKHYNLQAETLLNLTDKNWREQALSEVSPEIANLMQHWLAGTEETPDSFLKVSTLSRELRLRFLAISGDNLPSNRKQGAVIFIEDWSQLQTQAQQVKLVALGRLTANIAHEIRNPLSAISHANQLLQEEENNPASQRMLQIISDNVERVDQIINDVLELNRRDRTKQETIHVESFMSDFHHQFCAVEKIPAHCFTLSLKHTDTQISFDRRHLNQILWNLCKNAWRHSKQGENSLKLTVFLAGNIHIEVADDGDGIAEHVQSHLFEPFFTTENTGTGLGLYIARELAAANDATLDFKTASTGTRFSLLIKQIK